MLTLSLAILVSLTHLAKSITKGAHVSTHTPLALQSNIQRDQLDQLLVQYQPQMNLFNWINYLI